MKKLTLLLTLALCLSLLCGCAGTPVVYYSDCTCPTGAHTPTEPLSEGALKTGLAIVAAPDGLSNGESIGYDVSIVAVTVDDAGIIHSCVIDSAGPKVTIDAAGTVTADLTAPLQTKNELGDAYNMKLHGNARYEWYEQAAALAEYAVGKTVAQLRDGAVSQTGYAVDADLATRATIRLGGYVDAVEAAVANARPLGAQSGDELKLAVELSIGSSTSATADKAGLAQLDCDAVAVTVKDGRITSCSLDSLQAKVSFDAAGVITEPAPFRTKNQLGEAYGMKAHGKAKYEWNEQAANFAAYVTGKTAAEVANIAVVEGKPADADLATSVTVKIGGFQALIAEALQ